MFHDFIVFKFFSKEIIIRVKKNTSLRWRFQIETSKDFGDLLPLKCQLKIPKPSHFTHPTLCPMLLLLITLFVWTFKSLHWSFAMSVLSLNSLPNREHSSL